MEERERGAGRGSGGGNDGLRREGREEVSQDKKGKRTKVRENKSNERNRCSGEHGRKSERERERKKERLPADKDEQSE